MANTRRILFVLGELGVSYYNNYIRTSALNGIRDECIFIAPQELKGRDFGDIGDDRISWYNYPRVKQRRHRQLFNINTWRYRAKSSSFRSRFSRLKPRQQIVYKILALPGLYQLTRLLLLWRAYDSSLNRLVRKLKPDLVLIPSSAYEGVTFEIIKIANNMHVPTCLLIDNWDNISGKTVFTRMPDFIGVWSEQGAEHAQRIKNMPRDRIFIIGTPRFAEYFKSENRNLPSPYPFRYGVFAGSTARFDELSALNKLEEIIEKEKHDIKIVYRPHPNAERRLCADTFFEYDFRHVVLDNPARLYYKRELPSNFSPELTYDLSYFPKLLSNMEFMICPLSSMIIEGSIFNKRVAIPVYDDGVHTDVRGMGSPYKMFREYEHFKGIDQLPNVQLVKHIQEFENIFHDKAPEQNPVISLDYFITKTTADYPNNLKRLVDAILKT